MGVLISPQRFPSHCGLWVVHVGICFIFSFLFHGLRKERVNDVTLDDVTRCPGSIRQPLTSLSNWTNQEAAGAKALRRPV